MVRTGGWCLYGILWSPHDSQEMPTLWSFFVWTMGDSNDFQRIRLGPLVPRRDKKWAGIRWFFPQTFQRDPWCGRPRGRDNGTRTEIQGSTFLGGRLWSLSTGYHLHNYITYNHVRTPHVWDMGPQLYLTNYPLSSPTTFPWTLTEAPAIRSCYCMLSLKPRDIMVSWTCEKKKKIQGPNPVQDQC